MASDVRRAGSEILKLIESAADPAAVANQVLCYAKEAAGVTQLFARSSDGTVHQITPATGSVSNVVVWDSAKTWADAYTEILALTGPVICLVETGVGNIDRSMTPQGGGAPTNIYNVEFWALPEYNGLSSGSVQINVESGFVLGTDPNGVAMLLSRNISWNFDTDPDPVTALNTPVYLQFDGGVWRYNNATDYIFETDNFKMSLSNFAQVNAGGGGPGMVRLTGNNSIVRCRDHCVMSGGEIFVSPGVARTIQVYTDTTTDLSATFFSVDVTVNFAESQLYLISPNGVQWTGTIDNAGVVTWA